MNSYYNKDLYALLEVSPDADETKIKIAYRKQARKWHPDVNDNSQESIIKFKEITEAYEVLTDTQRRSQYDILKGFNTTNTKKSTSKAQEQQAKKAYTAPNKTNKENEKKANNDVKDDKSSFSQVFENILDGLFTNNVEQKRTPNKQSKPKSKNGRDINLNVTIKMSEAISGTNRTVNVLHSEECPKCEGRKFVNGAKCHICKGTGEISNHKKINVKIPAGIKNGAKIRIANEGNKGTNGGKNGDLYLLVNIKEESFFRYEGNNIYCEIPITPYEAVLGAQIDIPTICGNVSMKIPPNTTTGQKFRLSQQGTIDNKTKKRGDQIVTVKIEIPKTLSSEEIKLYEQLKQHSTQNIRENLIND